MDNDILNIDCETDIDEIIQDWSNRLSAQIQLTEELRVLHPRNLLNFIIHKTSGNVYRFIESLDELEQSRIATTDAMTTFNNVVARIVQEFTGRIPGAEASNEAFREHAYWRLINLKIKALEESYKTIATEETQKSKQFVSLNQHLQSQTAKLNAFNKMKNILTAKEKEEMRRPTVEKFQRLLDSLMNYNEVHATMLFYPKKRRNIGPKAVLMPEASPKDIYDYYVHGLVDTIYIYGETLKELQEFPLKVQGIIKGYKEIFARGRELFFKICSSYPIFDKEQKLLVPSITVAQLGVSNKGYPDKDEKIECAPPTIEDLVYSFMEVLAGSSKIGISPRQKDKIKINYCSKNLLIYSKFQERIDEVQLKVLSDFEDQIELFSGLLAPLPEDLKQQLCSYMSRNTRHHCYYCSEGISSTPIMEG
nr:enzymatic polyprotein [Tanacetum cinerariifolium]